jgi:hypothetical protein
VAGLPLHSHPKRKLVTGQQWQTLTGKFTYKNEAVDYFMSINRNNSESFV